MLNRNRSHQRRSGPKTLMRFLWGVTLGLSLVACSSGGGDEGGIIGTGVTLNGTTSSQQTFATNRVAIKAQSGETSEAVIGSNGLFDSSDVLGTGPYLMRVDLGNSEFLYAIGHADTDESVQQNIHSYTDVAARNWFASRNRNIDTVFTSSGAVSGLPTRTEIDQINSRISDIVELVLEEYDLAGTDLGRVTFSSNDMGVDRYLDLNPVLIQDDQIKIIVIDPDTNTQTEASSGVPLDVDLSQADTQAPTVPGTVRALPSALDEVVIVWSASTDNVGVASYLVYRDGVLVETTPFPVFIDSPLEPDTEYGYSIIAVDSAGNESAASPIEMTQTLGTVDSDAPPAPSSITLIPSVNSVAISWLQTEIFDVVGFEVFRSDSTSTSDIAIVTSNFMTDAGVLSGTEYCYQVRALDAAGNESPLSPISCVNTLGDQVTTDTTNPDTGGGGNNPDPSPDVGNLTAPVLDVSGQVCTENLSGSITTNTSVPAGCYTSSGIFVQSSANLVLQPGVIIKFQAGAQFTVLTGGSLTADGTAGQPIVLTGGEGTPGYWDGLEFSRSNSINNVLDHVLIEYAGSGTNGDANLHVESNSNSFSRVSITNTTLRHSASYGFSFERDSIVESFSRNLVTQNVRPGFAIDATIEALSTDSVYSGNAEDLIYLGSVNVSSPAAWNNLGVAYRSRTINVNAAWSIASGTRLQMEADSFVSISTNGSLSAVGTVTNPLVFTGVEPTDGFWDGMRFVNSNSSMNELEHVTIEYAGGSSNFSANLYMRSSGSLPSRLSASNVTLTNSSSDGFEIEDGSIMDSFNNIISTANARSGYVEVGSVGSIGPNGQFTGNAQDLIFIESGGIDVPAVWLTHDVPYFAQNISINSDLALSPGTQMIMDGGAEIYVGPDGSLNAVGTAAQRIVFTGEEPAAGFWDGIRFVFSSSSLNVLNHVIVEHGGLGGTPSDHGNIEVDCLSNSPGVVSLANTESNFSGGWGLLVDDTDCIVTLGENVTFSGNGVGGLSTGQ